jgi:hypothetical protein
VITKSDVVCKIFPPTFYGYVRVWYYNLNHRSIIGRHGLYVKLISHFSTIIPNKMSTTKLFFSITQLKGKSTKAYLKRFNKKMLSFGNLLELINIQALINEIYNYLLWELIHFPWQNTYQHETSDEEPYSSRESQCD